MREPFLSWAGDADLRQAVDALTSRLPEPLHPLARLAYNYRWSWDPEGEPAFRELDPHRWELCGMNPVRLLEETSPRTLREAAGDAAYCARVEALAERVHAELDRPWAEGPVAPEHPVAFLCAEFGIHGSLPLYSGGLGGLAGDLLKEASDLALPLVGVGLLYRQGYFHQRLDPSGMQHEYWVDTDPERLPAVLLTNGEQRPVRVEIPVWGRTALAQVWRVEVGRVPLFLLDTELPENDVLDRWITARLYDGNPSVRLAQYAVLGIGSVRALDRLGVTPGLWHLNEGHPALSTLTLLGRERAAGTPEPAARDAVRGKVVFTTHTPVPAGNEAYAAADIRAVLPALPEVSGLAMEAALALGRIHPEVVSEPSGMTPLAIRMSRHTNGVSARHGEVARAMWQPLFPGRPVEQVPVGHVTNGVHVPTWIAPTLRRLLDAHLPEGWIERADDPEVWAPVERIPDAELWAAREAARGLLVDYVRRRTVADRMRRGEPVDYAQAAARTFDPHLLTMGFARRLATYKRLHLITLDPDRALRLLEEPHPVQFLFAGKAHPRDEGAKAILQAIFRLKGAPHVGGRVAFLEDHDLAVGAWLVSGCDLWLNLPRPPLEASGTSGMKAAVNGVLNLSVLDGWWAEAWDAACGWAIPGDVDPHEEAKDARDAATLYDLLEEEVLPRFYDRDADGVPRAWVAMMKASMRTLGPRFSARRMLREYEREVYAAP